MSIVASFASILSSVVLASSAAAPPAAPPSAPPSAPPRRAPSTPPAPAPAPAPAPSVPSEAPAPSASDEAPAKAWVILETSKGTIVLELDGAKAPLSVKNFLGYTRKGFYDGTIFHRVMPNFMIQGGGFDTGGTQKPTDAPIKNEYRNGLSNTVGTIAMARTNNPDSATAQFFINVVDNLNLDGTADVPGYAVFGKVIGGMSTVESIRWVPRSVRTLMLRDASDVVARPAENVPVELVIIKSAKEASEADALKAAEAANAVPMPTPPPTPPKPPVRVPPPGTARPPAGGPPGAPSAPRTPAPPNAPSTPPSAPPPAPKAP